MEQISGSQALVQSLKLQSVDHVFGLIGSDLIPVFDVLRDTPEIEVVQSRHEAAAGNIANGYARIMGKPAVCMVHNGPGLTNVLTSVAIAYRAFSPLVLISGAPTRGQQYRDAIQELDQISLTRPMTKWNGTVPNVERIPEMVGRAFQIAMRGRSGPVHLDIPRDLFTQQARVEFPSLSAEMQNPGASSESILLVSSMLLSAQNPVVIAGGGVVASDATEGLVKLSEMLTLPVAVSYGHLDAFPGDHPLMIGELGRDGSKVARRIVGKSDVILAVGTRLGAFTTFFSKDYIPANSRIVQVEREASEIGRYFPVEAGITADAKSFLDSLVRHFEDLNQKTFAPNTLRLKSISYAKAEYSRDIDESYSFDAFPIKPQSAFKTLNEILKEDDIVVLDDGNAVAFGYHMLKFSKPHTFLSPLDLACIGSGYPTALGAKIARPNSNVFAVCGDGGFSMTLPELSTAVQYGINVIAIVLNNNCWAAEKAYQKYEYGERYFGCDLHNPSFAEVAEKFGVFATRVERASELLPALNSALDLDKPSLIEIMVDVDELNPPARTDLMREEYRR